MFNTQNRMLFFSALRGSHSQSIAASRVAHSSLRPHPVSLLEIPSLFRLTLSKVEDLIHLPFKPLPYHHLVTTQILLVDMISHSFQTSYSTASQTLNQPARVNRAQSVAVQPNSFGGSPFNTQGSANPFSSTQGQNPFLSGTANNSNPYGASPPATNANPFF